VITVLKATPLEGLLGGGGLPFLAICRVGYWQSKGIQVKCLRFIFHFLCYFSASCPLPLATSDGDAPHIDCNVLLWPWSPLLRSAQLFRLSGSQWSSICAMIPSLLVGGANNILRWCCGLSRPTWVEKYSASNLFYKVISWCSFFSHSKNHPRPCLIEFCDPNFCQWHPHRSLTVLNVTPHSTHIRQAARDTGCHIAHHPVHLLAEGAQSCHLRDKVYGGNLYPLTYAGQMQSLRCFSCCALCRQRGHSASPSMLLVERYLWFTLLWGFHASLKSECVLLMPSSCPQQHVLPKQYAFPFLYDIFIMTGWFWFSWIWWLQVSPLELQAAGCQLFSTSQSSFQNNTLVFQTKN